MAKSQINCASNVDTTSPYSCQAAINTLLSACHYAWQQQLLAQPWFRNKKLLLEEYGMGLVAKGRQGCKLRQGVFIEVTTSPTKQVNDAGELAILNLNVRSPRRFDVKLKPASPVIDWFLDFPFVTSYHADGGLQVHNVATKESKRFVTGLGRFFVPHFPETARKPIQRVFCDGAQIYLISSEWVFEWNRHWVPSSDLVARPLLNLGSRSWKLDYISKWSEHFLVLASQGLISMWDLRGRVEVYQYEADTSLAETFNVFTCKYGLLAVVTRSLLH
jgi:hypothetical protein